MANFLTKFCNFRYHGNIADFVLKIATFRCHGNQGMSEPNVTGIVELADPENPTIEPKVTTLSYMQPKLWQIFW